MEIHGKGLGITGCWRRTPLIVWSTLSFYLKERWYLTLNFAPEQNPFTFPVLPLKICHRKTLQSIHFLEAKKVLYISTATATHLPNSQAHCNLHISLHSFLQPLRLKKMYTLLGLSVISIEWQYRNHTEVSFSCSFAPKVSSLLKVDGKTLGYSPKCFILSFLVIYGLPFQWTSLISIILRNSCIEV